MFAKDGLLHLVRHGRAAAGIEDLDPGLDELGRRQARAAAALLARSGAHRLVVSPMRRTRETAMPIADATGLLAEVRDEVSEVFDPGMDQNARGALLGPLLAGRWTEQHTELRHWRERVLSALLELSESDVVVVSHFVAISVAIGAALGDDRVAPLPVPNASITRIEIRDRSFSLLEPASVTHLDVELVTGGNAALLGRHTRR